MTIFVSVVHSHDYSAFVMRTIPLFLPNVCVFLVQVCSWMIRYLLGYTALGLNHT